MTIWQLLGMVKAANVNQLQAVVKKSILDSSVLNLCIHTNDKSYIKFPDFSLIVSIRRYKLADKKDAEQAASQSEKKDDWEEIENICVSGKVDAHGRIKVSSE